LGCQSALPIGAHVGPRGPEIPYKKGHRVPATALDREAAPAGA
jgi:hypothetical protein